MTNSLTVLHRGVLCGLLVSAVALCSTQTGCMQYQLGMNSMYPADIRTVYVPMFESNSYRRNLAERLTEAVVKEIERRTPYKVVSTPAADSVLTGKLVEDKKSVLVEDRFDEPRETRLAMVVQVTWAGRQAAVDVPLDPITVDGHAEVVPEVGQSIASGHQRAIHRTATRIVDLMEIPWASAGGF